MQLTAQDLLTAGTYALQVQTTGGATPLSGGYPFQVVGNAITPSSNTVIFPAQRLTTASGLQSVTLTNSSGATLTGLTYAISGPNAANFQTGSARPATLASNASCTVSIVFMPDGVGTRTATLTILQNGTALASSITLTGTGAVPSFSVSASSYQFATIGVGLTDSRALPAVLNAGSLPLTNINAVVTGPNASEFQADNGACNWYGGLSPGSQCTAALTFRPISAGDKSAAVTITADYAAPQTIQISGHAGWLSFTVVPATLNFGSSAPVGTLLTRNAVLTNTGEVVLNNLSGRYTYTAISDLDGFQFSDCPIILRRAPGSRQA